MKKTFKYFILFILAVILAGCRNITEYSLEDILDEINIPEEVTTDLDLQTTYTLGDYVVSATWESTNIELIDNTGKVTRTFENKAVSLFLTLEGLDTTLLEIFDVTVIASDPQTIFVEALSLLEIPSETKIDLSLLDRINYHRQNIYLTWSSSNQEALTDEGEVGLIANDTNIILTVSSVINETKVSKDFNIKIIALSQSEKTDYIFSNLKFMEATTQNLNLPTIFGFGLSGEWSSSNPGVIDTNGVIQSVGGVSSRETVTLTLTLKTGESSTYTMDVIANNHMIIDRDLDGTIISNLEKNDDGKLVLIDGAIEGVYESLIYETHEFASYITSWSAITSTKSTVEVETNVRRNGSWRGYITSHPWGRGLANSSSGAAKYPQDEWDLDNIIPTTYNLTTITNKPAIRLKATLRRDTPNDESPILSSIAVTLEIDNYTYHIDRTNAPTKYDYEVPYLRQTDVPEIGSIICSPTSATMLLLYKGLDFSNYTNDQYPHRYMAGIVKDHNTGIYGAWAYNTIAMGSFGYDAYVKRMYSIDELLDHLDNIGPISASVKGTMVGVHHPVWTTSGHLIVIRGYEYKDDGLYIIANDPFKVGVFEEYKVENFERVWRFAAYVIE